MTDPIVVVVLALLILGLVSGTFVAVRLRTALDRRLSALETKIAEVGAASAREKQRASDALAAQPRAIADLAAQLREVERSVLRRVDERTRALRAGKQSVSERTRRAVAQDAHALLSLHSVLPMTAESLPLSGYSAAPDTILHLVSLVAELPDEALIVEFGSGVSTVWMSAAARREDRGIRIVSIDHDERWGGETRVALARLGLGDIAEVRIAPLEQLPGEPADATPWYAMSALAGLARIHLLVVDGPPAATGPGARFPALPRLLDRLAPAVRIVLDDTDRDDERQIVELWLAALAPTHWAVIERVLERTTIIVARPSAVAETGLSS